MGPQCLDWPLRDGQEGPKCLKRKVKEVAERVTLLAAGDGRSSTDPTHPPNKKEPENRPFFIWRRG
jgi:hypothetical protein